MYSIIEFEDGVLAIPTKWIDEDEKTCSYPNYKEEEKITEAIKKLEDVKNGWIRYSMLRILTTAKTYSLAKEKAELATRMTDVDDYDKVKKSRGNRKRKVRNDEIAKEKTDKKKKRNTSINTSDSELEDESPDEIYKSQSIFASTSFNTPPQPLLKKKSDESLALNKKRSYDDSNQNLSQEKEQNSESRSFIKEKENSDKVFTSEEKVDYLIALNQEILKNNKRILLEINDVQTTLKQSDRREHGSSSTSACGDNGKNKSNKMKINSYFPIKNMVDLEEVERLLEEDTPFKDDMVEVLAKRGGKDYHDLTNNIMFKIMVDTVAEGFSFKGRQKKKGFGEYMISKCVIFAVTSMFANITEHDVELKIGTWLANASTRISRKKAKQSQQQQLQGNDQENE